MNRGGGRGALIRKLLEIQSEANDSSRTDSGITGDRTTSSDETRPIRMVNPGTSSGESINATTRIESQTTSFMDATGGSGDSSIDHSIAPKARGRGKMIEILMKNAASKQGSAPSTVSSDESPISAAVMQSKFVGGRGRGIVLDGTDSLTHSESLKESGSVESGDKLSLELGDLSLKGDPEPVIKKGSAGQPIQVVTNYLRLKANPEMGVFEYDVSFSPTVDYLQFRYKYLNEHRETLGPTKLFDGNILSLPILLPNKVTILDSKNPTDGTPVEVTVTYRRKRRLGECLSLYNTLFNKIMTALKYVQFNQKKFDPSSPILIPQHKLEIWPGYVTAVDEYEGGLMLCLDVSHRVLCQTTVREHLSDIFRNDPSSFQDNALKSLLGQVVITRYNNRTYRVDDIDFSMNPMSTFDTNAGPISYVDYYKKHYNVVIQDLKQPLLISRKEVRVSGREKPNEMTFCLIPEIAFLTGLSQEIRSDMRVMRDLATHTRVTPNQRMKSFEKFVQNVNSSPEAKQLLAGWGLSLEYPTARIAGRVFDEELVFFGKNKKQQVGPQADFTRAATSNECIDVVDIDSWVLIHTKKDMKASEAFIGLFARNAKPMGINVSQPIVEILQNDRTETFVQALRKVITSQTQIIVIICPTARDDRYAAIKKVCCAEFPIPSQVINARTLSNDAKNRAIVQKIALQMNCKLGGSLWSVKIPFDGVMICGIDTFHEAGNKGNSVSAFIASRNSTFTKWYSRAVIQSRKEELINGLCASFKLSLEAYKLENQRYPDRIIIYRDGVGDGQLRMCSEYEIPQMREAIKLLGLADYNPKITFLVVQKRINTRLFVADRRTGELTNPGPGTVVDSDVTRKYLYDFFIVSQSVRQGTVSPTHFIVVQDDADFKPDILQRLSYKMTFLYYNWPGTVRVPACCQYAHKLAYLVGQSVKRQPAEKLSDKLYYL